MQGLWSHNISRQNSKLYSIDRLIIFQRAIFTNILPTTHLQTLDQKQHDVARHTSHDISRQNSKLYSINHYNFSESHLCKHTPYDLPTEMKSRKEVNKEHYRRKKDSIKAKYSPAQHKATYSPAQKKLKYSPAGRKLQHNATYTPAQRKLQYDATYSPAQRKRYTTQLKGNFNTKLHTLQLKGNLRHPTTEIIECQKVANEDLIRTHTKWS